MATSVVSLSAEVQIDPEVLELFERLGLIDESDNNESN